MTGQRLLDEVPYDGRPVTGDRSRPLLATLVAARGSAVSEAAPVEALLGATGPQRPACSVSLAGWVR